MLKAIVFDYGKVLTISPTHEDWARIAAVFGVSVEALQGPYWGLREDYDRGGYNADSYWHTVAERLGKTIANDRVPHLVALDDSQWMKENPEMLELAWQAQRAGLKIGILSNMQNDMLRAMRKKLAWLDQFDAQVYSCETGAVKPEPKSYHVVLKALGVEAGEAVFFDDKQVNVDGARAVGMHATLFEGDTDTAYEALEKLGTPAGGAEIRD